MKFFCVGVKDIRLTVYGGRSYLGCFLFFGHRGFVDVTAFTVRIADFNVGLDVIAKHVKTNARAAVLD